MLTPPSQPLPASQTQQNIQKPAAPQAINGFAWLLLFWMLGVGATVFVTPKIPAAIFGLFILFIALHLIPNQHKNDIYCVSDHLLEHMTLFFLPAGAGLFFLPPAIHTQLVGVLIVMVVSTILSTAGCALLLKCLCSRTSLSQGRDMPEKNNPTDTKRDAK